MLHKPTLWRGVFWGTLARKGCALKRRRFYGQLLHGVPFFLSQSGAGPLQPDSQECLSMAYEVLLTDTTTGCRGVVVSGSSMSKRRHLKMKFYWMADQRFNCS